MLIAAGTLNSRPAGAALASATVVAACLLTCLGLLQLLLACSAQLPAQTGPVCSDSCWTCSLVTYPDRLATHIQPLPGCLACITACLC